MDTRLRIAASIHQRLDIAFFPILADAVEVKTGSQSTAHWSNDFIRLNGWLRNCFAQLITPLDIDGIGQNWEESNGYGACPKNETCAFSEGLTHHYTGAGGVGYEKLLDWPPWKEPLPTRSWLTTP